MSTKYVGLSVQVLDQENENLNIKLSKFIGKEKKIILHNIVSDKITNGKLTQTVSMFNLK